jgi:hypothetical protein
MKHGTNSTKIKENIHPLSVLHAQRSVSWTHAQSYYSVLSDLSVERALHNNTPMRAYHTTHYPRALKNHEARFAGHDPSISNLPI